MCAQRIALSPRLAPWPLPEYCALTASAQICREHFTWRLTPAGSTPAEGHWKVSSPQSTHKHKSQRPPLFCESAERFRFVHAHVSLPQTSLFSLQPAPLTLKALFAAWGISSFPKTLRSLLVLCPLSKAGKGTSGASVPGTPPRL